MNITNLKVNTDRMNSDAQTLRERLNRTRTHCRQIKEQMDALNGMWKGYAHNAVAQQFAAEYENMCALCDLFEEMIENLEGIRTEYASCENEVMNTVNALKI